MLRERAATHAGVARAPATISAWARMRVATHWPLAVALGLVVLAGLPTLNFAYGPDQALFTYIGRALARGQTLYVDVWDVKPPGVFWVYALASQIPGDFRGIRAFDLLVTLAGAAAVYALGRFWWDRATGAVAAALFGVVYVTASGYWNLAQPDSFMILPALVGVLAWDGGLRGRMGWAALAAGLLFGLAAQFRPSVLFLPAVLVAADLLDPRRRSGLAGRTALLVAGGALMEALTLAWLALGGAVGEYLFAQFRFAGHYARLGGPYAYDRFTLGNFLSGLRGSLMWFVNSRLVLTVPAAAAVLVGGVLRRDRNVRLATALLLAAVAGVVVQAKFFIYHWHPVLPFLALLAGWAVLATCRALRERLSRGQAMLVTACAGVLLLLFTPQVTDPGIGEWLDLARYAREPGYRGVYFDRFGLRGHGTYSYRASLEVAGYVRARTRPGDTVFVWGYDPNFYLASGRDSASRFLSLLPLMPTFTPERWHEEFAAELRTRRPAYILLQRGENARWITGRTDDSYAWVEQYAPLRDLLARDYVFDQRIEDYYIYRRR